MNSKSLKCAILQKQTKNIIIHKIVLFLCFLKCPSLKHATYILFVSVFSTLSTLLNFFFQFKDYKNAYTFF